MTRMRHTHRLMDRCTNANLLHLSLVMSDYRLNSTLTLTTLRDHFIARITRAQTPTKAKQPNTRL